MGVYNTFTYIISCKHSTHKNIIKTHHGLIPVYWTYKKYLTFMTLLNMNISIYHSLQMNINNINYNGDKTNNQRHKDTKS